MNRLVLVAAKVLHRELLGDNVHMVAVVEREKLRLCGGNIHVTPTVHIDITLRRNPRE